MVVVRTSEAESPTPRRSIPWALVAFFVLLGAWSAYWLGCIAYVVWMRHHPHVQVGQNDVLLGLALYSLVLGDLVILGLGIIVRRISQRRHSLFVG